MTGSFPERVAARVRSLARRFLLFTLVVIGALCGVVAVLFHHAVELARTFLIGRAVEGHGVVRIVLILLIPTVTFALLAAAIRRFAPRAVGANLARVRMAYNRDTALLSPRSIVATFVATPLSLGAGAPMGPEGPIVVITSGVSAAVARLLQLPRKLVRGMIPVGVAAGIAAIFNTPITGVVFAVEEVFGASERGLLGGVLVGAVAAAVVERLLLGGQSVLAAPTSTWRDARELIGFAILGVAAGVVSGFAIAVTHRLKRAWARVMPSMVLRAALAGALIGAFGLIVPSILGVGYDSVSFWLHGGSSASQTALAFTMKTLGFIVAIAGGVLGGTFAPSLFMGAALGSAIGHSAVLLFPAAGIDPKAYSIVGMGCFFAGLLRSPIAAVLIAVELTRDYDLIVPLMLAVSLAVSISRRISPLSIVEQQMVDEGFVEEHEASDPLAGVLVADAMSAGPVTVGADATLREAAQLVAGTHHPFYPVVDAGGVLSGVVARVAIERGLADGDAEGSVRPLIEAPRLVLAVDENVVDAVHRMQLEGVDRCAVIDGESSRRVVGFLSPSDILRARMAHSARSEDELPFEVFS